jgi:hypothetical protein
MITLSLTRPYSACDVQERFSSNHHVNTVSFSYGSHWLSWMLLLQDLPSHPILMVISGQGSAKEPLAIDANQESNE